MIHLEKSHFATTVVIIDSGKDYHWLLKPYGEQLLGSRMFIQFESITHGLLLITKQKSAFKTEKSVRHF